jgi:curved DNA-binding protein CbpA
LILPPGSCHWNLTLTFLPQSAALKTHPDRIPADHPQRAERTRKFQLVNDAYYTLSDSTRRRDYDAQRKFYYPQPGGFSTADPFAEENTGVPPPPPPGAGGGAGGPSPAGTAFSWAWNFFTGQGQGRADQDADRERTENEQFADVFEEMLREEGMADPAGTGRPTSKFWSVLGGLSGGALGFIVANVPGLVAGAVAGNRLGAVRDARGKSVYAVFQVSFSCRGRISRGDMRGRVVGSERLTGHTGTSAGRPRKVA